MEQGGSKQLSTQNFEKPLISIIMATYNADSVLKGAIESITANAAPNTELLIIDGGSTDDTLTILKEYDRYITTWKSEPDKGIYDALNKGAALVKGRWVYFMGADDRLLPGFKEMAKLLKDENTIYYGNVIPESPIFLGEFTEYKLAKFCMNHQTILYPAKVFKKYSYNLRYRMYADYALNIACWGDRSLIKKYHEIDVAFYSTKGYSSTATDDLFQQDKLMLIKKNMSWVTYLRFLLKKVKEKRKPGSLFNIVNPQV